MAKNIVIVILSLGLLVCLYVGVYGWITSDTAQAMQSDHPELEWLRREYHLTDTQFSDIRERHEAHDLVCREMCRELVDVQKKLDAAILNNEEVTGEVRDALAAWAAQRERCHEATLLHMYDVSSVMDEESATRYRERVLRHLIIPGKMPHIGKNGEFHEALIEHAAPDSSASMPPDDD